MAAEETAAALMLMAAAMATRQQSTIRILGWVAGQVAEWVAGWDPGRVARRIAGGVRFEQCFQQYVGKEYVCGTE